VRARNSYLLAGLSGVLLLLSLPPFKFGGVLAWFAFVPILIALYYETRAKRMDRLAKVAGLGSLPLFLWFAWWLPEMSSLAHLEHLFWLWFVIGLAFSIYMAVGFYGDYYAKDYWKPKHLPSKALPYLPSVLQIFVIPIYMTGVEFLTLNIPGVMQLGGALGLWSVAKTQWLNPPMLKLASLTGMYGVTFLVFLVNCAIAYGILHYRETKQVFKMAVAVLVIFAIIFSYGAVTVPPERDGDVTVAIIQIPEETENLQQQSLELSEVALKYDPEFIIWSTFVFKDLTVEPYVDFAQTNDVYLAGWGREGNALVSPTGEIAYHNMHYNFFTIPQRIGQGDIKSIFFPDIHGIHTEFGSVGILECVEAGSTLPAKDFANKGVQFLLVNTASPSAYVYSWALGTSAIYRAVEHRMFAVEVIGDHDSSMIIDPYGRIVEDIAPEPEIVAGKIAFTDERTFYSKYGDIFGWTIAGLSILLIGYNLYLKRRSPYAFCKKCRAQMEKGTKVCPNCGKKRR